MTATFVYVTAASEIEAERLARAAVGERLAACANIIPGMRSLYWWQGKIDEGRETVLILKTVAHAGGGPVNGEPFLIAAVCASVG